MPNLPAPDTGGDNPEPDINEPLDIPDGTRAICVRYAENPPLYEIYRKSDNTEEVHIRTKELDENGYIIASEGGTSDNMMNDGTPYYPVMAVAADINFDPPKSNNVVDIKRSTDADETAEAKL